MQKWNFDSEEPHQNMILLPHAFSGTRSPSTCVFTNGVFFFAVRAYFFLLTNVIRNKNKREKLSVFEARRLLITLDRAAIIGLSTSLHQQNLWQCFFGCSREKEITIFTIVSEKTNSWLHERMVVKQSFLSIECFCK